MKKALLTFMVLVSFMVLSSFTVKEAEKPEIIAKYLVSLVRYIKWPEEMKDGNFKIGVYGSFDVYKAISKLTMGTGLQHRNVDVMNLTKIEQVSFSKFHILLVAESKCNKDVLVKAKSVIGENPTLLITEKVGAISQGSAINFVTANNKLGYEFNKANATTNGILVNKQVETFATRVY